MGWIPSKHVLSARIILRVEESSILLFLHIDFMHIVSLVSINTIVYSH